MATGQFEIHEREALTAAESAAVRALRERCDALEGLDLKVELRFATARFLALASGEVVGYASLDGSREMELCGMVAPERRRQGVGRALLDAAVAYARRRNAERLLMICEDASQSGRAFVAATGAHFDFAEHRMELPLATFTPGDQSALGERLTITPVIWGDAEAVEGAIQVVAAGFGNGEEIARERVVVELAEGDARYRLARLDGAPVATLKLYSEPPRVGIYGFAVAPAYRRRGVGRGMLSAILEMLRREGSEAAWLEVDTDNAPALGLYRSLGFTVTTTYGYYVVPV